MADLKITLQGMENAEAQLRRIERGSKRMAEYQGRVFSRAPQAWGMEFGRHRVSGKLARRAGGVYYLSRAVQTIESSGEVDLAEGLTKVTAPGPWVLRRLGRWARRLGRLNAPRGTARPQKRADGKRRKRLRQTIHADVRKRGT
jgi:hypothetical protein